MPGKKLNLALTPHFTGNWPVQQLLDRPREWGNRKHQPELPESERT